MAEPWSVELDEGGEAVVVVRAEGQQVLRLGAHDALDLASRLQRAVEALELMR